MLHFNFKKTTDPAMELCYKGYIRKRQRLKNGWSVLILVNHVAVLSMAGKKDIIVGCFKNFFEAHDGKFMLVKRDLTKAVFSSTGQMLADFSSDTNLFANGWYTVSENDDVKLFDEHQKLICANITKACVFDDGRYFISVLSGGDATKVGFHNADGSLIIFTNDRFFKRLFLSFFIADGSLYDLSGECLIEANQGSTFNRHLVRFIGSLPFWKTLS